MSIPGKEALLNIKKLYRIFNSKQQRAFNWLIFLTFLSSVSDLVGLSFIIPIIGLVLSENFYASLATFIPSVSEIEKNTLLLYAITIFFLVILLKNILGLLVNKVQVNFVAALYISSSANVLNKIYKRSYIELLQNTSGRIANKLSGMQMGLANIVTLSAITVINETMIFAITSIILLVWNWQLFLLMLLVVVPIMGYFYARIKRTIRNSGIEKNTIISKLIAHAQEMVFGYADIKIAGTEYSYKEHYKQLAKEYSSHQSKLNFINFIPTRILEIAVFLCIIVILLYCVFVMRDMTKILTTISLFSVVAYRSIPSVNRLVMSLTQINVHEFVLNDPDFLPEEIIATNTHNQSITFNKSIRFDNVSYKYPNSDSYVLNNCNLEIRKGEKVGIVGKSGAGKSTIINNILGFIQPTNGCIFIDNTPLTEDNITSWWKMLGYVRQEVFILNSTFMENVVMGEPNEKVDHDKLKRAIQLASLDKLVDSWPKGIHTMLTERGSNLSGGQKQRIAIARAIYKGADILIFDEATSSLDHKTEEEITASIRELGHEDLTIIIIAHRYTSLKYCDKIYRLENGSITERITYEDLATQTEN